MDLRSFYLLEKRGKDFNLCTVRKMPKVYDNKLQLLFQSLFTALSLLPHLRKVIRFYRLEKNLGSTTTEILKRIYLNSHILSANLDWIHFGFATQTIGSGTRCESYSFKNGR